MKTINEEKTKLEIILMANDNEVYSLLSVSTYETNSLEYAIEMKIGAMMIFGSVFIVGMALLLVYIKLYKPYHSPKRLEQ